MCLLCLFGSSSFDRRLADRSQSGRNSLAIGVNQNQDACYDKGNGENLSHIQSHILLETYLRLLDELDEEAHSETAQEEGPEKEAAGHLVETVLVDENEDDAEDKV